MASMWLKRVSVLVTFRAAQISRGCLHTRPEAPGGRSFLSAFIFSSSLFGLEFRGQRERTSIRPSITCPPPLTVSVAASLQLISGPQAVVTTHHIMTATTHWPPLLGPARSPPLHLGLQLAPVRCHYPEMKGQQLFPVWPLDAQSPPSPLSILLSPTPPSPPVKASHFP